MHRKRSLSVVLGIASLSAMVLLLSAAVGPALGKVSTHSAAKVTVISVTAGKPAELAFKLSKFSSLPAGSITFNVTNMGVAYHDFKICTTPTSSAAKNSCVGKATGVLHHGQKATLTLVLKNGKYEYLCTVVGHAAAGMKGLIGVGVKVAAPVPVVVAKTTTTTPTRTTTPTPTTTTTPAGGGGGGGGGGGVQECPPGQTIAVNGPGDQDEDDGGAQSDGDGCI